MPTERIRVGARPNDGAGDPLRIAFEKANRNFELLASAVAARIASMAPIQAQRHEHADYVPRFLSDKPPTQAPPAFGAMWIDSTAGRIYLAVGTQSVSHWREVRLADS
jgi:hypothetical protein